MDDSVKDEDVLLHLIDCTERLSISLSEEIDQLKNMMEPQIGSVFARIVDSISNTLHFQSRTIIALEEKVTFMESEKTSEQRGTTLKQEGKSESECGIADYSQEDDLAQQELASDDKQDQNKGIQKSQNTCPTGHPLMTTKRNEEWICDICELRYEAGTDSNRCTTCDYDACKNCWEDPEELDENVLSYGFLEDIDEDERDEEQVFEEVDEMVLSDDGTEEDIVEDEKKVKEDILFILTQLALEEDDEVVLSDGTEEDIVEDERGEKQTLEEVDEVVLSDGIKGDIFEDEIGDKQVREGLEGVLSDETKGDIFEDEIGDKQVLERLGEGLFSDRIEKDIFEDEIGEEQVVEKGDGGLLSDGAEEDIDEDESGEKQAVEDIDEFGLVDGIIEEDFFEDERGKEQVLEEVDGSVLSNGTEELIYEDERGEDQGTEMKMKMGEIQTAGGLRGTEDTIDQQAITIQI